MIGIMGGTFNPIHNGHLLICEFIREEFGLEKVLFVPARTPPHKGSEGIAPASDRIEMVRLAAAGNRYFEVSDIEMKRQGASYTVDTLNDLAEIYGSDARLALIIGADSLMQFRTWKRYEEIITAADILVARRPDTEDRKLELAIANLTDGLNARIAVSEAIPHDFSSTEIRRRVREGLSIKYMVPERVEEYILETGLYK